MKKLKLRSLLQQGHTPLQSNCKTFQCSSRTQPHFIQCPWRWQTQWVLHVIHSNMMKQELMCKIKTATWWGIPWSTYCSHINSRHATLVAFHVTPLVDGMQQCSCLEGTNHYLLLLQFSLPMLLAVPAGLPYRPCTGSCLGCASIFLIRAHQKSLWNFLTIIWKKEHNFLEYPL